MLLSTLGGSCTPVATNGDQPKAKEGKRNFDTTTKPVPRKGKETCHSNQRVRNQLRENVVVVATMSLVIQLMNNGSAMPVPLWVLSFVGQTEGNQVVQTFL